MTTEVEISVVVPVYNSSRILPELLSRLSKVLKDNFQTYEIILVDDCSPDESSEVIRQISVENPIVRGFQTIQNLGQFSTTLQGIRQASGRYIVNIDDDLEYAPEDIPSLYQYLKEHSKWVVFGMSPDKYRLKGGSGQLASWRNRVLNFIWNKMETDSFRVFKRELVFKGERFVPTVHFEAFISRVVKTDEVGYVEVSYQSRFHGASNYSLLKKVYSFFLLSAEYWNIHPVLFLLSFTSGSLMGFLFNWKMGLVCFVLVLFASSLYWKSRGSSFKSLIRELGKTTFKPIQE